MNFRFILLPCIILIFTQLIFAQMPPNPELLKKIKNGEISIPFALKNLTEIREKGIDKAGAPSVKRFIEKSSILSKNNSISSIKQTKYNAIMILVDFPDKPFKSSTQYFDKLLFTEGTKTLPDFLREVTYGNIELSTENLPSSVGIIRAPHPYTYYCDGKNGMGAYPNNSQKLVEDIISAVDSKIDFSNYDNDGDGQIDALFIIHAGPGAEFTGKNDDIWSHAWSISSQNRDHVRISSYSIEPEYWKVSGDMTLGVFAHEMGHAAFGLPDLYDYDDGKEASEGLGTWSLMAGGSWNGDNGDSPAHPDVWCKSQMGLLNVVNITSDIKNLEIKAIIDTPVTYRLWKDGAQSKEYFLLENRQKKGYDQTLPGSGLLIYHVDDDVFSNDNQWYPGHTGNGHYHVAIEQADGNFDLEKNLNSGDSGDPFPGILHTSLINSDTRPGTRDYAFNYTNIAISNIHNSGELITADLSVKDCLHLTANKVDYGYAEINKMMDTTSFKIINSGTDPITINGFQNLNSKFQITAGVNFPYNLTSNDYITIKVSFLPDNEELILDTLTFSFNPGNYTRVVPLKGQGYKIIPVNEGLLYGAARSPLGSLIKINALTAQGEIIGEPGFPEVKSLTISNTNKQIYAIEIASNISYLCRVNAADGGIYRYLLLDKTVNSIAFNNANELYGADGSGELYKIDISTGACQFLGNTNLGISDIKFNPVNNILYACVASGDVKDGIYTIDLQTGAATLIGRTGLDGYLQCIGFDRSGNMYAIQGSYLFAGELLKIDAVSGQGTLIGNTGFKGIKGLATYSNDITGVSQNPVQEINNFSLEQNYPNPFNPVTKIRYQIPENVQVSLKIFDLLGREVAVLVNKEQLKGIYNIEFYGSNLSSGIYIYQLKAGSFIQSRKLTLLK